MLELVKDLCNGNAEAERFCVAYSEIVALVDDWIDGDKKWEKEHIVKAFTNFTLQMLGNQFVLDNAKNFIPLIVQAGNDFLQSEELIKTGSPQDLATANVLKSSWNSVLWITAMICGGQDHSIAMMNKYRHYNDPKDEFNIQPAEGPKSVAEYYDKVTGAYLESLGDHIQVSAWDANRFISDELQFQRIGVKPGDNILDAGCGVLGPALNLLKLHPTCTVTGITISEGQFKVGQSRITPELEANLKVINGDYQQNTGLKEESFDGIMFLESFSHATDREALAKECRRLLKPGGWLYVIGWFLPEKDMSSKDWIEVIRHRNEFQDNPCHFCEGMQPFLHNGFNVEFSERNIGQFINFDPILASVRKADGSPSSLAQYHKTTAWFDLLKMADFKLIKTKV